MAQQSLLFFICKLERKPLTAPEPTSLGSPIFRRTEASDQHPRHTLICTPSCPVPLCDPGWLRSLSLYRTHDPTTVPPPTMVVKSQEVTHTRRLLTLCRARLALYTPTSTAPSAADITTQTLQGVLKRKGSCARLGWLWRAGPDKSQRYHDSVTDQIPY